MEEKTAVISMASTEANPEVTDSGRLSANYLWLKEKIVSDGHSE